MMNLPKTRKLFAKPMTASRWMKHYETICDELADFLDHEEDSPGEVVSREKYEALQNSLQLHEKDLKMKLNEIRKLHIQIDAHKEKYRDEQTIHINQIDALREENARLGQMTTINHAEFQKARDELIAAKNEIRALERALQDQRSSPWPRTNRPILGGE